MSRYRFAFWLLLALQPLSSQAEECNLAAHFGPVSFENERPGAALRKILAGTGIALIESGEFNTGTISARNVSGTVGEVIQRLTEGPGLRYSCHNGVMRVEQSPAAIGEQSVSSGKGLVTEPFSGTSASLNQPHEPNALSPNQAVLHVQKGDSLKAILTGFAKQYQYEVSWTGDDLYAKQNAEFTGDSFEDVANKFFVAAKITGYLSNDEGKIRNVLVR